MKKIDKIHHAIFDCFDDINTWIKEQPFYVYVINVMYAGAGEYELFYGKIKEEEQ